MLSLLVWGDDFVSLLSKTCGKIALSYFCAFLSVVIEPPFDSPFESLYHMRNCHSSLGLVITNMNTKENRARASLQVSPNGSGHHFSKRRFTSPTWVANWNAKRIGKNEKMFMFYVVLSCTRKQALARLLSSPLSVSLTRGDFPSLIGNPVCERLDFHCFCELFGRFLALASSSE